VSCEDDLGVARVGNWVLEQFDQPSGKLRMQAGVNLVVQQKVALAERREDRGL